MLKVAMRMRLFWFFYVQKEVETEREDEMAVFHRGDFLGIFSVVIIIIFVSLP